MGTVIIGFIVLAAAVFAAASVIRDKKKGKCAGCSCDCGNSYECTNSIFPEKSGEY